MRWIGSGLENTGDPPAARAAGGCGAAGRTFINPPVSLGLDTSESLVVP
jgi:hypothetical protein